MTQPPLANTVVSISAAEPGSLPPELAGKAAALADNLGALGSVAVAFSGGVDSALVLAVAHAVLGNRAVGVTAVSASLPSRELAAAQTLARQLGARHVTIRTDELANADYVANAPSRCFHCKQELYSRLGALRAELGVEWVVDGYNLDDEGDYRPGRQAARANGVRSPLHEARLTKADVRALARARGLPVWNKPALACLSSRIPYGTPVTVEALRRIEAAEVALHDLGFAGCRVRHHDTVARIEVDPADFDRVLAQREAITAGVRAAGYAFVALDLVGYRSGALNEVLPLTVRRTPRP